LYKQLKVLYQILKDHQHLDNMSQEQPHITTAVMAAVAK
jgi:hypothetical protein